MNRTKTQDDVSALPEPMALTPDQLMEMAAATAGGLSFASLGIVIRAGGYPPFPTYGTAGFAVAY